MKRFEASSTLIVETPHIRKCNIDQKFDQSCNIQNKHDNNRTVTFSDQDSDESIFKVPLQSTSSGYYSLDETENDSSKSIASNSKSYKKSDFNETIFKPVRVSTSKRASVTSECCSSVNLTRLQSFDSFCQNNQIHKISDCKKIQSPDKSLNAQPFENS